MVGTDVVMHVYRYSLCCLFISHIMSFLTIFITRNDFCYYNILQLGVVNMHDHHSNT